MKSKLFILTLGSIVISSILFVNNVRSDSKYEDIYFPPQGDDIKVENIN